MLIKYAANFYWNSRVDELQRSSHSVWCYRIKQISPKSVFMYICLRQMKTVDAKDAVVLVLIENGSASLSSPILDSMKVSWCLLSYTIYSDHFMIWYRLLSTIYHGQFNCYINLWPRFNLTNRKAVFNRGQDSLACVNYSISRGHHIISLGRDIIIRCQATKVDQLKCVVYLAVATNYKCIVHVRS